MYWNASGLQCFRTGSTSADADSLIDGGDEDLSVADLARLGGAFDGVDGSAELVILDGDFEFEFGEDINDVFGAAVDFAVTFLAAKSLGFGDGHALDTYLVEGRANLVLSMGPGNGGDEFQGIFFTERSDVRRLTADDSFRVLSTDAKYPVHRVVDPAITIRFVARSQAIYASDRYDWVFPPDGNAPD